MSHFHSSCVLICCAVLIAGCGTFSATANPTLDAETSSASPTAPVTSSPFATRRSTLPPVRSSEAPVATLSGEASEYLAEALSFIEATAYRSDQVDWPAVRRRAFALAQGGLTPADTYRSIRYALQSLRDGHSFFWTPQTVEEMEKAAAHAPTPSVRTVEARIGYIDLPGFGGDEKQASRYIASAHKGVRRVDETSTCGWVVDLRNNGGGNMWPMLAAAGPILGEGDVGAFVYRDGRRLEWSYRGGRALLDGRVLARGTDYQLKKQRPPVAVLTGRRTASSGEAIVVAFRARRNTRSFGQPTYGVPTANDDKRLSDGAVLGVMTALDADRAGRTYDGRIAPDHAVDNAPTPEDPNRDHTVQAALTWLRAQPACRQ